MSQKGKAVKDEFQKLFDELPLGVVVLGRDQDIRYANASFCEFVGYDREELQGISILSITGSYDQGELDEGLRQLYAGERTHFEVETSYRRKDGKIVWGHPVRMLHPNPAIDDEDTVLMFVVDITKRRNLQQQLRHSEKMNALGMLAGSVAHDFNNVLTVIKTFVGLLEADPYDPEFIVENVDRIRRTCDRGERLARQLTEFARQESTTVEEVEINEYLINIEEMFSRLLPSTIELELSLTGENPVVNIEEDRLNQILMSLVLNARDAMESRGTIAIDTELTTLDQADFPDTEEFVEGTYARLRICDDGAGISSDLLPHIFEPFFTTKGKAGSGMGLTTVYGIVEEDKGYIQVSSKAGEGTCFEIYLPASSGIEKHDSGSLGPPPASP